MSRGCIFNLNNYKLEVVSPWYVFQDILGHSTLPSRPLLRHSCSLWSLASLPRSRCRLGWGHLWSMGKTYNGVCCPLCVLPGLGQARMPPGPVYTALPSIDRFLHPSIYQVYVNIFVYRNLILQIIFKYIYIYILIVMYILQHYCILCIIWNLQYIFETYIYQLKK